MMDEDADAVGVVGIGCHFPGGTVNVTMYRNVLFL